MSSRARNKLNIKQVAAISKPGIYSDGGGLYLRVRPGGRSWIFIGTFEGKRFEIGIGIAQKVSLAEARKQAEHFRALIFDGKDPRFEKQEAEAERSPENRFGSFAMQYVTDIEEGFKNPKHRQQWRNTLQTYAKPLFDLPLAKISTEHVLAVLKPIWLAKPETASRVRGRIERILDAAKAKGLRSGDNPARARGHLELLLPKRSKIEVKHHAALPFDEMAAFMEELRKRPAIAARALEFTILTAARSGEVRGLTWAELDISAMLWKVPASRMKAGKEHIVPLSADAVTIVTELKKKSDKPTDFVFKSPRGGPLSNMAMSQLLNRIGRTDITVHGFRSSFRDWAGDKTLFGREEVEMALAHTIASATERAYRRGHALEKRRELMEAWVQYCGNGELTGSGGNGSNVLFMPFASSLGKGQRITLKRR
ncbi:integrase arm-type DNA-binding domain-containing protein [Sphingorhabdus sp.]|jgi:integrase|uniref:tyrosine-type recombinase/integrase n=1 Tax=Sphingorhabdus sp. TaxID=1902408 RepID=UPI002C921A9B|nr:integrase arm-type DNA-binding domain-containing protein [Sphingorhabdus sp.]HMT42699.1 tyrosine-type recombinase/integrase [Sphingorhabdus sp.]